MDIEAYPNYFQRNFYETITLISIHEHQINTYDTYVCVHISVTYTIHTFSFVYGDFFSYVFQYYF